MKIILRSIILKGIMNIEGYDAVDLVSEDKMHLIEDKIESWFDLYEQFFNITNSYSYQIGNDVGRIIYDIDKVLLLLIVPGYEKKQAAKEDLQR